MNIEIKLLDPALRDYLPAYSTAGSAGLDLRANIKEPFTLAPNEVTLIPTGLAIHIRDSQYCGLSLPRSGLGHKNGLILGNGTGLIDADYQGELKVSLWNRSETPFVVESLARIAQLVIVPVIQAKWDIVSEFGETTLRASGGYGSTGTN